MQRTRWHLRPNVFRVFTHYLPALRRAFATVRDNIRVHQSLVILTLFILINNAITVYAAPHSAFFSSDTVISDPYQIADTVRLLQEFTPNIAENPDAIAMSLEEQVTGNFVKTNPLIATLPGESDEPSPASSPAPKSTSAVATSRTNDIKYTVQIGDTISGIGSKFNLKIASIQVKNNLSNVDTIKPGQELVIPVQDVSDRAIKAAEERKQASQSLATTATKQPTITAKATGGYGLIVPIRHNGISRGLVGGHTGIDYRASVGTPIMAAADGVVSIASESGWNGGYGKTVLLTHAGGKTTRYGHLSDVSVSTGQRVSQGQVIGLSGNTGRSTGPHLHFELRVSGAARNPF